MRITSKGQVTIPARIRAKAGLLPNTEVDFVLDGNTVTLVKAKARKGKKPIKAWIERMTGSATVKLTTDEIMKMTRDW
jgi:AbrB family looped-hinge helix DNA binding protein